MWEALTPAHTASDLGTEYDPFVIGWRSQPAVSQHQVERAAGGRSLGIVEASETLRLEPVTA